MSDSIVVTIPSNVFLNLNAAREFNSVPVPPFSILFVFLSSQKYLYKLDSWWRGRARARVLPDFDFGNIDSEHFPRKHLI